MIDSNLNGDVRPKFMKKVFSTKFFLRFDLFPQYYGFKLLIQHE